MNTPKSFEQESLFAFISVLGSEERDLPIHLWEELKNFSHDRSQWTWNTFEKILSFMNNWINQYNKSLPTPVLVSIAAIMKSKDRSFYVLSDSYFGCVVTNDDLYFIGQRIMQHHQDSVLQKREILVPQTLLGAFDSLPAHLYDELMNGQLLIFPQETNILDLKNIFEESGKDFETFSTFLTDNNFKYIGGR